MHGRHYTFYLWKDVLLHEVVRYALLPAYVFSAWSLLVSLQAARTPALLILGIVAAACITLVPAGLVEFR